MTAGKEYNYTYENDVLVRAAEFTITVNADGLVTEKVPVDSVTYTYNTDGKLVKKRILPADGAERLIYYEASDAEETIVRINTGERTVLFHGKTDSFGRKEFDEMQLGGKGYLSRQFSYHEGVITQEHEEKEKLKSSPTTSLVSRITFTNGRTLTYEYDEEERITKVIDSLGETTEYTYDALGQLWTEKVNGVVVNDMEYDNYGNITKKNGIRYTYTDGQWKDLLTGYGSQTIAYDAQGNPTSYLGHTLTWEKGRQLKTFDNNTYTYNANGIRTGKTVNGVTHTYQLEGSGILRESWKENGHTYELIPLYDNENSVCGIIYENATYYFQKNLQGDVIALVDANAQVAARYTYDAWGSVTGVKTKDGAAITDTAHIAYVNPFRYRGHYLDRETGLYYLQSRYYDPVVGRFVNADELLYLGASRTVLGVNIFVYCENNSIKYSDTLGYFVLQLAGGGTMMATYTMAGAVGASNAWNPVGWLILGALALAITVVVGCTIVQQINASRSKERSEATIKLADVKVKEQKGRPYCLAYISAYGGMVKSEEKMTFVEALIALGISGAVNSINKRYTYNKEYSSFAQRELEHKGSGHWGIYSDSQFAAKALAVVFGWSGKPEVHGSGMYGHYHDSTHTFHIWYGGVISY